MNKSRWVVLMAVFLIISFFAAPLPAVSLTEDPVREDPVVLFLEGTPGEEGEQYGELAREAIKGNLALFWRKADEKGLTREEALQKGLQLEDYLADTNPDLVEEIRGMARTAGVGYQELLAFNALEEKVFEDGCTNFLATGSATLDGRAYFHKNRDGSSGAEQVIIERSSPGHYRYIAITSAGSTGVSMGINEYGVSTGNTALTTWDTGSGSGNLTINRFILESSKDVAEGVAVVLGASRSSGSNFHIADSEEAAFLQASHSAAAVRWVVDEAIANSNHYTLPEMLDYEDRENMNSTHERYERGNELLQESLGEIDIFTMIDISRDRVGVYTINNARTLSAGTFDGTDTAMYAQLGRPDFTPLLLYKDFVEVPGFERDLIIDEAVEAIEAIPPALTIYDVMEVRIPRSIVERAYALGAVAEDIANLADLLAAEEAIEALYRDSYMRTSLLELTAPLEDAIEGHTIVARNRAERWWEGHTINNMCLLPLGSVSISYVSIGLDSWPEGRWIEYDVSGRGFEYVKGYAGINDYSLRHGYPTTFQVHADGDLIYAELLEFGEYPAFYLVDIEGAETVRFTWFAEDTDDGRANETVFVEPQFLKPIDQEMLDAIADAEAAIGDLPAQLSFLDIPAVEQARALVDAALALGVERATPRPAGIEENIYEDRIENLEDLLAAEEAVYSLYHQYFEADSIIDLTGINVAPPGRNVIFEREDRWNVFEGPYGQGIVNFRSFAPLKVFTGQWSVRNALDGRSRGYDVSGYLYVQGFLAVSDDRDELTHHMHRPLEFTIFGDGEPLVEAILHYGADAVFYRLDLKEVDEIMLFWDGPAEWCNLPAFVEPFFYHSPRMADALVAAEDAIAALPDLPDLTEGDRSDVEAARAAVNNALFIGADEGDIDNLEELATAELRLDNLDVLPGLIAAAIDAIDDLPLPADITLEDRDDIEAARDAVNEILALGGTAGEITNLDLLEAAEEALQALPDVIVTIGEVEGFTLDDTVTVPVSIANASLMAGGEFVISYDPDIVTPVGIEKGELLEALEITYNGLENFVLLEANFDYTAESFKVVWASGISVAEAEAPAEGVLFEVEFAVNAAGVSPLTGSELAVYDIDDLGSQEIDSAWEDGQITIEDHYAPLAVTSVEADAGSAETGTEVTWSVEAVGGEAPLEYAYYLYRDGERIMTRWYVQDAAAFSYTAPAGEAGLYRVRAFVRDASGRIASLLSPEFEFTGETHYAPLAVSSVEADVGSAETGTEVTWSVEAVGGEAPLEYAYYLYRDGERVMTQWYAEDAGTFSYTAPAGEAGLYRVRAFVRDASGRIASLLSPEFEFTGEAHYAPLAVTSVEADAGSAETGTEVTWSVEAVGGEAPLEYAYYLYHDGERIMTRWYAEGDSTFSYAAPAGEAGLYRVRAFVRDAGGRIDAMLSPVFEFTGEALFTPLTILEVATEESVVPVGTEVTWTVDTEGGVEPLEYAYYLFKGDERIKLRWYEEDAAAYTATLDEAGLYLVRAFVRDAGGRMVYMQSAELLVEQVPVE